MKEWPQIDYLGWRETAEALHLYLQVVGKYRLAHTPWLNHSWHATFYVGARGWTTSLIPDGPGIEVEFDLIGHHVVARSTEGREDSLPLGPMSVAEFHRRFVAMIAGLGGDPRFDGAPNEVPHPVPFAEDERERCWDGEAVTRFFRATVLVDGVFKRFRTSFLGKCSPVHLFWGSFDLAVTRFSGRTAPLHPGGVPALPDDVAQEAYDHEVASAGFWPGGGGLDYPAFYAYAYPAPSGYAASRIGPEAAFFSNDLGEFILPYDAVRESADPEAALLQFLQTTYEAAADLGGWDREALECAPGRPREPRTVRAPTPAAATADGASEPTVEKDEGPSKGVYRLTIDGHRAEMTYSVAGEKLIIIDHTEVPDALRGKGVGQRLVERAVMDARASGRSILPLCPFAKATLDKRPEWQDVLRR
ncbi:DUF5996 family protein [Consotaella salsifontis]|uniref:Predicted acetyltransferase, GNAT superfamily n=1 Tax=Consotaella salsifontis TaxID=1365950 RepID=A0A1T4SCK6_9HYPH|nr:DUF5996 family protein [Consotaella salsifontis]SKA25856.1 Predicted acetyltransferase, GNAT superfamily [Consotaella salsifontis]